MNKIQLKEKIILELEKKEFPNMEFLFSTEVLSVALDLLREMLDEEKIKFEKLLKTKKEDITFEVLYEDSKMDIFRSLLNHFYNVSNTQEIRNIIEKFEPSIIKFSNEVSFNKRYYEIHKICLKNNLTIDQKRELELSIKEFEIKWISLNKDKQNNLKEISSQIAKTTQNFSNNLLDSESEFYYFAENENNFKQLEENDLNILRENAKKKWKKWLVFDSSVHSYLSVMKYCSNQEIRKHFYKIRNSFASEGKFDNRKNVLDIISLKKQKANILWYTSYNDLSFEFKMASNKEEVESHIKKIYIKTRAKALDEIKVIKEYFNLKELKSWDVSYFFRKYKQEKFDFDENYLKKYFLFEKVIEGLFKITKDLFWIDVNLMKNYEKYSYNCDVKIYEVKKDWNLIFYFVQDYFYRDKKGSWAWNNTIRSLYKDKKTIIVNVANIVKSNNNILLSLREIETLFHEFWHALHRGFSQHTFPYLWADIEWDFVELPSQLMENWVLERESLDLFAFHIESWEKIPDDLYKKIKYLDTFWVWNQYLWYHYLELFDLLVHSDNIPNTVEELDNLFIKTLKEYNIFNLSENNKRYTSFDHVFAWWYASWFYSYLWAEILEKDVFEEFKKKWILNKEVWQKYFDTILSKWAIKPAKDLFYDFMGREVDNTAFMERKGLN